MALTRFINTSKVDQIIYYGGRRHSIIPGGTILLPLAEGRKYRQVLKQAPKKYQPVEEE